MMPLNEFGQTHIDIQQLQMELALLEADKQQSQDNSQSNAISKMARAMMSKSGGSGSPTGSLYPGTTGAAPALQQAGMPDYGAMSTPEIMNGAPFSASPSAAPASSAAPANGTGGSSFGSFGPYAALAAVIYANEHNASKKEGARSPGFQRYKDMIGGKVMEQDAHHRWQKDNYLSDKWFNDENDSMGLANQMKMDSNLLTGDFSNAYKNFKHSVGPKTIKKIGHVFG